MYIRLLILIFSLSSLICHSQTRNLEYYINQGIINSPLLKDYKNQVLSGYIDSQQISASYKPQINATSNDFYAPVINGYGYDPVITNYGAYNALVNVGQPFVGRKNLKAQYRGIRLQNDSVEAERKISEQDLKRAITAQYITTYGDLQQVRFNNQISGLLNNEDTILIKLTRSNIYHQSDYLIFKVTLQQQHLQIKQLMIQYQTDLATLNYMCGIYDTASTLLDSPHIRLDLPPDPMSSVFFKKFIIDSLRLSNNILLLNYNYRPKVNAFVNGGFNSSLLYQGYKNWGSSFGVNVAVPIYDGHQKRLQYEKIKLLENTRSNYQDFFTKQYNEQVALLKHQLASTEDIVNDIQGQIKYSETLINVDGKLITTGDAKITDFIIAINNYLTAQNLMVQNTISRLQIINQINYWYR